MNRFSIDLGTYAGIPVKLHWSFWFIFVVVAYAGWMEGMGGLDIFLFMLLTLCLFFCVLLHEFGHALTAFKFGIKTQDIILSPIGGIARMQRMPDDPGQEILVAFAGPAVNVVICLFLGLFIWAMGWDFFPSFETPSFQSFSIFISSIFWMNAILFTFNLVPAFPMDGGRVFRAILAYKWNKLTATKIAVYFGQAIALVFIFIGLWNYQLVLPFIGIFIIVTGRTELNNTKHQHIYENTVASDVMSKEFLLEYPDKSIYDIYTRLTDSQYNTAVIHDYNGHVKGSVTRQDLYSTFSESGSTHLSIGDVLSNNLEILYAHQPLGEVITAFNSQEYNSIPVLSGEIIVGIIHRNTLREWLDTI